MQFVISSPKLIYAVHHAQGLNFDDVEIMA